MQNFLKYYAKFPFLNHIGFDSRMPNCITRPARFHRRETEGEFVKRNDTQVVPYGACLNNSGYLLNDTLVVPYGVCQMMAVINGAKA